MITNRSVIAVATAVIVSLSSAGLFGQVPLRTVDLVRICWLKSFAETVGLYHFHGNLSDASNCHNDMTGVNIQNSDYTSGVLGANMAALGVVGEHGPNPHPTSQYAILESHAASDFDMGMSSFSIEVITKPSAGDPYRRGLVCKKENYYLWAPGWELELVNEGTTELPYDILMDIGDGENGIHQHWTQVNRYNGDWIYIVVTVDRQNNEMMLYVNGEPHRHAIDISAITGELSNTTKAFTIGRHISDPHHDYSGVIDEVCITKRVLTHQEVLDRNPILP